MVAGLTAASGSLFADTPIKDVPAPKLLAVEKEHLDKLDEALAPLLSKTPSPEDVQHLRDAVGAVRSNNMESFSEAKAQITDPVGRKLADWIRLRNGMGELAEYEAFLKDNPLWPGRSVLTEHLEAALFTEGGSAKEIKKYFAASPPQTGIGYAALAAANLADGNTEEARKLAAKVWREMTIPAGLEAGFLKRFGDLLTPADHQWRFNRMVTDDVRWAGNRADRAAFARRIIPLLPAAEQKKATARLAVFNRASNARALMSALPSGGAGDTGLAFHRIQLLRKAGKIEEAAKVILAIPPDPTKIAVLDEWWAERRELAYGALKMDKMKLAYELVKNAGPLTVNPLKEQTFMAGWIAFRYLNKPGVAEKHFKDFAAAADGPLSRAKAAYWLGRVADARGDKAEAARQYRLATKNPDTFHGLLAMQMLQNGRTNLDIKPPALPSPQQVRKFVSLDAAKALVMASKAKLSRVYTRSFLIGLGNETAERGRSRHGRARRRCTGRSTDVRQDRKKRGRPGTEPADVRLPDIVIPIL